MFSFHFRENTLPSWFLEEVVCAVFSIKCMQNNRCHVYRIKVRKLRNLTRPYHVKSGRNINKYADSPTSSLYCSDGLKHSIGILFNSSYIAHGHCCCVGFEKWKKTIQRETSPEVCSVKLINETLFYHERLIKPISLSTRLSSAEADFAKMY